MTDPRVLRTRQALLTAALDELAEVGYAAFAMESVATRAGVGRSTLYRHWPDRLTLISDALETLNVQPRPAAAPEGETAIERVENLLRHLTEVLVRPPFSGCVPALVHAAEQDATVRAFHHRYSARRRQALVVAIDAGVASGEFRAGDPDVSADALSGAIFYRRLMTAHPVRPEDVPALVDEVLGREQR